jgi:hypothetical protein
MRRYSVFGGSLASDLELPDLMEAGGTDVDWTVRTCLSAPAPDPVERVGEHAVGPWVYELYRLGEGWRLVFAGHYIWDVLAGGREIVWYRDERATAENVRALLLGPVLALANESSGALCLHGSAVSVGGKGIAFLGSKHQGKSTLSLALTHAGARFLTDDSVLLDLDEPIRVRPGVQSFRLWSDSASALRAADLGASLIPGRKNTLTSLADPLLERSAVPLEAVYLLHPVRPKHALEAAVRIELPRSTAAALLACHGKLPAPLVGRSGSIRQLQRAASVVRRTRVFSLNVVRDFERLAEAVAEILKWHAHASARMTSAKEECRVP